jgi:hypothetical protein
MDKGTVILGFFLFGWIPLGLLVAGAMFLLEKCGLMCRTDLKTHNNHPYPWSDHWS